MLHSFRGVRSSPCELINSAGSRPQELVCSQVQEGGLYTRTSITYTSVLPVRWPLMCNNMKSKPVLSTSSSDES